MYSGASARRGVMGVTLPDLDVLAAIHWRWGAHLPATVSGYYRADPPEAVMSPKWFARHDRQDHRCAVAHEVGHHLTGAVYRRDVPRAERRRLEGRAERRGLRWLVEDDDVTAAIGDGCREVWEFAAEWEIPESAARRRLELFLAQHPEYRIAC